MRSKWHRVKNLSSTVVALEQLDDLMGTVIGKGVDCTEQTSIQIEFIFLYCRIINKLVEYLIANEKYLKVDEEIKLHCSILKRPSVRQIKKDFTRYFLLRR